MTLSNSVKVGIDFSEPFDTVRDFRQGEPLSCDLFNFVIESVLRKVKVHCNDTIFQKTVQLLAYVDDIDIIGRTKREATAAFSAIGRKSTKMGMAVNEGKTKYTLSTSRYLRLIDSQITADNYTFDTVNEFIYLDSAITTKNNVSLEIKLIMITLVNKMLMLHVLLYGTEAWTLLTTDAPALRVFEKKFLRKIFGLVRVCDDFRVGSVSELYELINDIDIVHGY